MRARLAPLLALALAAALMGGCQNRDRSLYDDAEKLWLNDQHDEAISKLQLLVTEYPSSSLVSKALFRLGEIYYLNLRDHVKALDYFIRVTEREGLTELNLQAHRYIADIYEGSVRDYDLAILQYQKILNNFRSLVQPGEYQLAIGRAYFRKGDCRQAIIELEALLNDNSKSQFALDARYQIANCYQLLGQRKEAIEMYERMTEDYPRGKYDYDIRLALGVSYEEMDNLEKAAQVYQTMERDYPDRELIARRLDSARKRLNSRRPKGE